MKKKFALIVAAVSIVSMGLMAFSPANIVQASIEGHRGPGTDPSALPLNTDGTVMGQGYGQSTGSGMRGTGTGYALTPLSTEESEDLLRAIEEEYTARALYESVITDFGDVVPFNEIVLSETQHATVLIRQANKYGLDVPVYTSIDFPAFATIEEACQAGVDAEIADAALYDELMAETTRTDLIRVYTNLQSASLTSHLPQFEACN
jgi:hypothetical protein